MRVGTLDISGLCYVRSFADWRVTHIRTIQLTPFNEYEIFRLSAYTDVYELQPIRENGHVRRHAETARESPPHAAKATRLSG